MREFLSKEGINYEYIDVTDSMSNLKVFLKFRDSRVEFNKIREVGRVGIPCVILNEGEEIIFEVNESDIKAIKAE